MKLHLSPRVTISSLPPQTEAVRYNDALVYYCSPHLYVASISTSKILHKSKYEDVQMLGVHGDLLYVCTSDIYILDPCSYELLDVIRLSKALINGVAFFGNSILVSKVSNKIVHISDRKAILEFSVASLCEGLLLNQFFYGYYDFERVVVFSGSGVKAYEMEIDEIICAAPLGNKIFVVDAHGTLTELVSGKSIDLGLEPSLCHMSQSSIFTVNGDVVYEMDYTGAVIDRQVVSEMMGEYCGFVRDICGAKHTVAESVDQVKKLKIDGSAGVCGPSGDGQSDDRLNSEPSNCSLDSDGVSEDKSMDSMPDGLSDDHRPYQESSVDSSCLGSSGSGALGIASLGEGFVKTSENDFVFIKDKKVQKIISFVDDVTDSMEYKGNLILSTSSGLVKYTDLSQYSEGEYVFGSRIVRVSFDSITSAKISDGIVVTGSKDKSCQVFKLIPERTRLTFARIYEFRNFRAPITSLAFEKNVLAVASSDNILQIYRSEQQNMVRDSAEDCALYFSTFENVSTQHVHSKPITHVSITPMFIVTSSADRSSMVLDHNGTLVRTLHSDKILNSSCDHKYIAIGSHKAIKVYHNPSLAQLSVFQSKRPVLSGCFHSGYFLGVTDVLRVYDLSKKKCVKSYDLGLTNCWSFNYPFLCAENKIVMLEDTSKKMHEDLLSSVRTLKESTALVDRFLGEGRFGDAVEILLKKGDCKRIHKAVVEGFYSDRSLGFLERLLKNGDLRSRMVECLLKNSSFKHSEVFNTVAQRLSGTRLDKDKKEKMLQVVRKHAGAVDGMFVDLLSLDIFNKQL